MRFSRDGKEIYKNKLDCISNSFLFEGFNSDIQKTVLNESIYEIRYKMKYNLLTHTHSFF